MGGASALAGTAGVWGQGDNGLTETKFGAVGSVAGELLVVTALWWIGRRHRKPSPQPARPPLSHDGAGPSGVEEAETRR